MEQKPKHQHPIRVLIVDDSTVMRAVIGKALNKISPNITVVGYAENGGSALKALDVCDPDIVILDVEMPGMDGMTALPLILKKKPRARIIICSSFTEQGAEVSVKALSLGAAECVLKPVNSKDAKAAEDFENALKRAVLVFGDGAAAPRESVTAPIVPRNVADFSGFRPAIVAIGSSTGGPRALLALFKELGPLPVPVLITQHIQERFTPVLARHIERETGISCDVAEEGAVLQPSRAYLAPGGRHMQIKRSASAVTIHLDNGPPENFCKPSVDVMLRSAVEACGGGVLAVILTGMGSDGLKGCRQVAAAGGRILVQDQASSVVWGMPGAVANADMGSIIAPLSNIAATIRKSFAEPEKPSGAR